MRRIVLAIAVLLIAASAATAGPPPAYFVDETKLPFGELSGIPTHRDWGVNNGAGYRIEVPENWNGSLVMWAHGYRGTGLELTVDNHPLRAFLIANGYAWAASSYRRNDYDPATGAQDTHAPDDAVQREVRHARTDVHHRGIDGWPRHRRGGRAVAEVVRRSDADLRSPRRLRAVRLLPRLQRRGAGAVGSQGNSSPSQPTT